MSELDATDVEILRLLLEDARRSYREIAEEVGLSPPSVSNRVDRLRELGVIERFTLELDRTRFTGADETLLTVETRPADGADVLSLLESTEGIEQVFQTVESRVVAKAVLSPADVHSLFAEELDDERIDGYRVEPLVRSAWHPQLGSGDFDLECAVCGNAVTDDGETVTLDSGERHRVCCSSCAGEIVDQYESLRDAADG